MAQRKATTASSQPSVESIREIYETSPRQKENFAKGEKALKQLKDLNGGTVTQNIPTINRETLRNYFSNVSSYSAKFRDAARYLYHRSNIFYRVVNWYVSMFCLECRRVTPPYTITKNNNVNKLKKSLNETFDTLDILNFQNTLIPGLINCFVEDVFYGIRYTDNSGTIIIPIPQEYCQIDGQYMTGDYSYGVEIQKLARNKNWKYIIENIGDPLLAMLRESEKTGMKFIHMPDEYAVCLKFDTKDINVVIPPLARIMIQLSALEDNIDAQAVADQLSIFKLVYLPLPTLNGAKDSNDWKIDPELAIPYFNKILDEALPKYVSGAMVPGDELKTIDFAQNADNDINRVQSATDSIFATAGGGAILSTKYMNNTFALQIWLKEETAFALNTLLPQIEGLTNRVLSYEVGNPSNVHYFEVSPYTREDKAKELLEACQYSFADRLAYQSLIGISEKETLAMLYMENELLGLPDIMQFPLISSHTTSNTGNEEGGRPETPADELTDSGERTRNK